MYKSICPEEGSYNSVCFLVWKSVDFQKRESYDMLGISYVNHPRLKCILMPSKLSFWSLRFCQFCHFSPNFKPVAILVPVISCFCHFGPNFKFGQIPQLKTFYFFLYPQRHCSHFEIIITRF
ncbi:putative NADH:ubiquinone oxidoreductase, 30kDa subunit [Helianthus debilis subsp. tardiflorus]